jgi:LysR family transcriptional regulator, nitrogen assimilation regulatory protein
MDFRKLKQFLSIVEAGSLSGAATRLNIAQPALSQAVQALEAELGAPLLERHARGVKLTEFGALLADQARIILRQVDQARDLLRDRLTKPSGTVRLAVPPLLSGIFGLPLLEQLRKQEATVEFTAVERESGQCSEAILAGTVDLALSYCNQGNPNLAIRPLIVEELVAAIPKDVCLSGGINLGTLCDLELILPPRGDPLRDIIDDAAGRDGIRLKTAAEFSAHADILQCVAAGYASVLPRRIVENAVSAGTASLASFQDLRLPCCLFLVSPRPHSLPHHVGLFRDLLVEMVEAMSLAGSLGGRFVGGLESEARLVSVIANQR